MVLRMLSVGLHGRAAQRKEYDCTSIQYSLRCYHSESVQLSGMITLLSQEPLLIRYKVPGGNTTSNDGCAAQFGVSQSVFGEGGQGVTSKDDCQNLPESLRPACEWRFDWLQDASYPRYAYSHLLIAMYLTLHSANFKRVVCPSEITERTGCVRNDDVTLAEQLSGNGTSATNSLAHTTRAPFGLAAFAASLAVWLLSI